MFNIAIRLGGATYVEGECLNISDVGGTLDLMRSYYSRFGLGNKTGIDVPGEVEGYMGYGNLPGITLNYSIGQLDMYTPLQLLQYVSVIATGGSMYQIHLMGHVNESGSENVVETQGAVLKSTLSNTESLSSDSGRFPRLCYGRKLWYGDPGGASRRSRGQNRHGRSWRIYDGQLVGYAPYDNPTVSFACSAPTSADNAHD